MDELKDKLEKMGQVLHDEKKQPIFFIGSGLSKRYLDTPNWEGLLTQIAEKVACDYKTIAESCNEEYEEIARELEYYCFRNAGSEELEAYKTGRRKIFRNLIAEIFKQYAQKYAEDMVLKQSEEFNEEIINQLQGVGSIETSSDASKIQKLAEGYDNITKNMLKYSDSLKKELEIQALQRISPRAIITTNYDTLLEEIIFTQRCNVHIGQGGFSENRCGDGTKMDLYKIHGCVTKPESIIITKEDYDNFSSKSKYLYSKLFTFFWEYPVIFIGYSITDRNIKDILTAMIEIMTEEQKNEFLEHIWIVDYAKSDEKERVEDKEIELSNGKQIKVPCFYLKYYLDLFQTISQVGSVQRFGELDFTISENVIELLIEPLYQQQDEIKVVVRELLQNALDACKKKGIPAKVNIKVYETDNDCYLEIRDNGIGMDLQELKENFLTVGKTNKNGNCEGLVGKYGIGILSVFLIGNRAKVYTKKDAGELLSLEIYMKDEKKQVRWLDPKDVDIEDVGGKSFTIIRIYLKESMESKDENKPMEMLGLESYVTKAGNSITVDYKGDGYKVPEILEDWFLQEADNIKIYRFENNDTEETSLSDSEKKLKEIMDRKNLILYNDMISQVVYQKAAYNQLSHIKMPFVILDIKKAEDAEEDVKTDLSRNGLQIRGSVMGSIAKGVYQIEIEKIMDIIKNSQREEEESGSDIYDLQRQLRDGSEIMRNDVDILMYKGKLCFSRISVWPHLRVYGKEEIAKGFLEGIGNPALYSKKCMDKSEVSDVIENDALVCISEKYLSDYLFSATNQHNGLRKQALIKILRFLGEDVDENQWIRDLWIEIKDKRDSLQQKFYLMAPDGILWLDESFNRSDIEAYGDYFIVYKFNWVSRFLDKDFCEIFQEEVKKNALEGVIGIYEGKAL